VPLTSLPLNERRSDIPALVEHFLKMFSARNGIQLDQFKPETVQFLTHYNYRGNIRELKNLVERMLILGEDDVIEGLGQSPGKPGTGGIDFAAYESLKMFKEAMEKQFLIAKLRQNNGNISKTAEAIDTPRSNLYKKLEQYSIKVEEVMGKQA